MLHRRPIINACVFPLLAVICTAITSCSTDALFTLTAATSDFTPGTGAPTPRVISVGFVNNTPFRAIFTYGAYDHLDQESIPTNFGQLRLEGNTASAQIPQPCQQTFSVGGDALITLIQENRADPSINITDERALVRGVYFSGAPLGDPLEAEPTEGTAQGLVLMAGVDFTCARTDIRETTGTGLLTFTFEQDATTVSGFRIDYSFIQP